MTPQQARFVREYLLCSVGSEAARKAGYSESYCQKGITQLLNNPAVAAAIAEHRATLAQNTNYDLGAAVAEVDSLITDARRAKQFTAAASLLTVKVKLHGLLIERAVQLTAQVDVAEALKEARARLQQPRPALLASPILNATATEVPGSRRHFQHRRRRKHIACPA